MYLNNNCMFHTAKWRGESFLKCLVVTTLDRLDVDFDNDRSTD